MSFGKRGASPSPRGPDNGAAEASPLWRQLRTIGIGVAVGLGIAAFNFALLPYMGRAQEKRFEQQLDGGYAHALSGKSDWAKTLRVYCSPPGTLRRASASTRDEFDPMRRALLEQGEELKTRAVMRKRVAPPSIRSRSTSPDAAKACDWPPGLSARQHRNSKPTIAPRPRNMAAKTT
jgi:hypothetical protein